MTTLTGRIRSVDVLTYGDVLTTAASIGDSVLYLDDASDFDEDGGYALVDGFPRQYLSADLDADTITLVTPLAAAHDEGDLIQVWDNVTKTLSTDLVAEVAVEGAEFADDALEAIVLHSLVALVPIGIRGADGGETVVMEFRGDDLFIIDVLGKGNDATSIAYVNDDTLTYGGTGNPVISLSAWPIVDSLQVKQNGHELDPDEWTYDSALNLVTVASGVHKKTNDKFTVYYARNNGSNVARDPGPIINWGSPGPNLIVAEGDLTDRSGRTYDDSSWTVSDAPVGWPLSPPDPFWSIPPATSSGSSGVNLGFWLRREFYLDQASTLTVSARVDGKHYLFLDGVLIHSYTGTVPGADPYPSVTGISVGPGRHVVALHVDDDTNDGIPDYIYGDVYVEVT